MTQNELARLARVTVFQDRIEYLMVKAALAKLNAANPPQSDILLGQRVLDGGESVHRWALAVLCNASIAAGAHNADGSTITENDLEFAVNSVWSAFAA